MNYIRNILSVLLLPFLLGFATIQDSNRTQHVDLTPYVDTTRVLENPHKGWYQHYIDDKLGRYHGSVEELYNFPGMRVLFIRLSWSHFEPLEDQYDWCYIDYVANTFVPEGYRIGVAVTCKETREVFGTPRWVMEAGAKGEFVGESDRKIWEPDFGDPVFLEKLNDFHKDFAERYGDKDWLEFVQIASYGTWGEGHNWPYSKKNWPNKTLKKHVQMYLDHYPGDLDICVNDDMYFTSPDSQEFKEYIEKLMKERKLFWTDHSILVNGYIQKYPDTWCLRSPELFRDSWKKRPTQIEFEHYHAVKRHNNWPDPGLPMVKKAIREAHATWIGFHGDAATWQRDNPELACELANQCGYWYILEAAELPKVAEAGKSFECNLKWKNNGIALAYHPYELIMKISGDGGEILLKQDARNQNWMPGVTVEESYDFKLPPDLENGKYEMKIKLCDEQDTGWDIDLALNENLKDAEGFFSLAEVIIQ